jgi:hypothetical protein
MVGWNERFKALILTYRVVATRIITCYDMEVGVRQVCTLFGKSKSEGETVQIYA